MADNLQVFPDMRIRRVKLQKPMGPDEGWVVSLHYEREGKYLVTLGFGMTADEAFDDVVRRVTMRHSPEFDDTEGLPF